MCTSMHSPTTPFNVSLAGYNRAMFDILEALKSGYPYKPAIEPSMLTFFTKKGDVHVLPTGEAVITKRGSRVLDMHRKLRETTFLGE